jgi:phosphoribosylanthranilate isomerase
MFIKICGITSAEDARMVARAGANAIGLNFYRSSPRFVEVATAHEIVAALPPYVDAVGVFVNCDSPEISHVAHQLGLRTVQLHGDVSPELVARLRAFSVIPAFPLADEASVRAVLDFLTGCSRLGRLPNAVLADAHRSGMYGGTGQLAPWGLARRLVEQSPVPVALAGGLTAKNVTEAIQAVRPWAVDVASGVEVAPGRKESYKVSRFIEAARKVPTR